MWAPKMPNKERGFWGGENWFQEWEGEKKGGKFSFSSCKDDFFFNFWRLWISYLHGVGNTGIDHKMVCHMPYMLLYIVTRILRQRCLSCCASSSPWSWWKQWRTWEKVHVLQHVRARRAWMKMHICCPLGVSLGLPCHPKKSRPCLSSMSTFKNSMHFLSI